jgi:hypothetical protein
MALKLGEALIKGSLITKDQLKLALERQVIFGGRIGTNLVELGILRERELASFLSSFFKVPAVDPSLLVSIDEETISCISRETAEKYKIVPFRKERNRLSLAMLEPRSMARIDELRFVTGFEIIPHAITELRLLHALEKYYGAERDLRYISIFSKEEAEAAEKRGEDSKELFLKVKEQFAGVKEKEEVIGILLNESKKISSRAAVFIVQGARLKGWKSRGLNVDSVEISVVPNSVFADVLQRKSHYRGPLLRIPENEALVEVLGGTPQDCLLIPIQIREKIIALLYVDNGNVSVLDASLNYINTLVTLSAMSFELVILRRKILEL